MDGLTQRRIIRKERKRIRSIRAVIEILVERLWVAPSAPARQIIRDKIRKAKQAFMLNEPDIKIWKPVNEILAPTDIEINNARFRNALTRRRKNHA